MLTKDLKKGQYKRNWQSNNERLQAQLVQGKILEGSPWGKVPVTVLFLHWDILALAQNLSFIWDNPFKNGPSKIVGRQPLKKLLGPFLNTLSHYDILYRKHWNFDKFFTVDHWIRNWAVSTSFAIMHKLKRVLSKCSHHIRK